jgi:hypothetical protein
VGLSTFVFLFLLFLFILSNSLLTSTVIRQVHLFSSFFLFIKLNLKVFVSSLLINLLWIITFSKHILDNFYCLLHIPVRCSTFPLCCHVPSCAFPRFLPRLSRANSLPFPRCARAKKERKGHSTKGGECVFSKRRNTNNTEHACGAFSCILATVSRTGDSLAKVCREFSHTAVYRYPMQSKIMHSGFCAVSSCK